MHMKWFFDRIQYDCLEWVKVGPWVVNIHIRRLVDKQFPKYLSLELDQTAPFVSTRWVVNAHDMIFQSDPIWLSGVHRSWSTIGEN